MLSSTLLLAIVTTCVIIAIVNKLTKGALYGMLQVVGIITLAIIVVLFLSTYEYIADQLNYATKKIEEWWSTAAVLSAVLLGIIGLGFWVWMFWYWLFNM